MVAPLDKLRVPWRHMGLYGKPMSLTDDSGWQG
jgi:hypothetical protein